VLKDREIKTKKDIIMESFEGKAAYHLIVEIQV
jgi:hypothetical protein